ncbi:MAG: glutamate-1-semialdehyde 2,1-aminomutase [Bacteroidota bacterium]
MTHTYNTQTSKDLFYEANQYIPGGVNSPVRAFKSVGGDPIFIKRAEGAYIYDEDGNAYVELINSWGPMLMGHAHPVVREAVAEALSRSFSFGAPTEIEIQMAKLIVDAVPSVEKVRMVNSGTEATMSAIRLARGYTSKDKIIKFAGCYHGHGDSFLIAAGSGAVTFGVPNSPGVTDGIAQDTLIAEFNNLDHVRELVEANKGNVASIILEPITGNMGVIIPEPGFLDGLRRICDEEGIVLIFDEVMTGFRLTYHSAQSILGVTPDITCLGKIIGGGMPVGAYGGKKEIMDFVSPSGPVYQAGTLSGNPIAMAAGVATLTYLRDHPEVYASANQATRSLSEGLHDLLNEKGIAHTLPTIGSMFTLFFNPDPVKKFEDAQACDMERFAKFFRMMLERGVYMPPSQYEAMFVSAATGEKEVDHVLSAAKASLELL